MISFTHTISRTSNTVRTESCNGEAPKPIGNHGSSSQTTIWKVQGIGSIIERVIPPSQLENYNQGKKFVSIYIQNPISHSVTENGKVIDLGKWYQNSNTWYIDQSERATTWPSSSTTYQKYISPSLTLNCTINYSYSSSISIRTSFTDSDSPSPSPSPDPSPTPSPTPEPECDCDYNAIAREMRSKHADLFALIKR